MSFPNSLPEVSGIYSLNQIEEKKTTNIEEEQPQPIQMITGTSKKEFEQAGSIRQQLLLDENIVSDLLWEALILTGKGNKEQAIGLVEGKSVVETFKWKSQRPEEIDSFFDKLVVDFLTGKPQRINQTGLLESIGVCSHDRYLNDYSISGMKKKLEEAKTYLETLKSYDFNSLNPDQQISYKIFLWQLNHEVEREPFLFHQYAVTQRFGPLTDLTQTFTVFHKLETIESFNTYLARLGCIFKQFQQIKALMIKQKKRGITPPKFALEKVLEGLKKFIESPLNENPFYKYVGENLKLPAELKEVSMQKVQFQIKTKVIPAYTDLIEFVADFSKNVTTNHGLLGLPHGKEYYAYCLKQQTTRDLTAEDIYQLGLKEVAIIQAEMRLLLDSVGITDPQKEVGELMAQLTENERFFYPDTEEGKKDCLMGFQAILERSRKELSQFFDLKPDQIVKIVPTPKHEEDGMPVGYYYEPSIDGSRPGIFYVNLRNTKELPKFGMETLLVHEAEPGHHFQLTLQNQSKIPLLRKFGEFNAYIEGWALYTEKLAYEKGFYTTTYDKLGHLQDELLRAVRLVVDPAIHAKGWSREEAIVYMQKQTGYKRETVETEIERYFVVPGQACSYKIGQLTILELRKKAMDQLGDKFDIREFHNVILGIGACPLTVLEEMVAKYIDIKKEPKLSS